jgi:hypothetical protein
MTMRLQLVSCSFDALRREGASAPLGIHRRRALGEVNIPQRSALEREREICHDEGSSDSPLSLHRSKSLRAKPETCLLEKCRGRSSNEAHRLVLRASGSVHDERHHKSSLDTLISLLLWISKVSGAWYRPRLATVGDYERRDISEAGRLPGTWRSGSPVWGTRQDETDPTQDHAIERSHCVFV